MKTRSEASSDPCVHTRKVQQMLTEVIDHLREDLDRSAFKIFSPSARSMT